MTNYFCINHIFIHHLAPTFCGIKPSSLFTLAKNDFSDSDFRYWKNLLKKQNLSLVAFESSSGRWVIFAYNFIWLRQILSDSVIQAYLRGKEYSNPMHTLQTIKDLLDRLKKKSGFPHEIGIFLGYPFEDVIHFEENQGRNCKYCGYWKSYCNPEEAKRCCNQYKCCSQMCKQWFEEGLSVPQIINKYKEVAQSAA